MHPRVMRDELPRSALEIEWQEHDAGRYATPLPPILGPFPQRGHHTYQYRTMPCPGFVKTYPYLAISQLTPKLL